MRGRPALQAAQRDTPDLSGLPNQAFSDWPVPLGNRVFWDPPSVDASCDLAPLKVEPTDPAIQAGAKVREGRARKSEERLDFMRRQFQADPQTGPGGIPEEFLAKPLVGEQPAERPFHILLAHAVLRDSALISGHIDQELDRRDRPDDQLEPPVAREVGRPRYQNGLREAQGELDPRGADTPAPERGARALNEPTRQAHFAPRYTPDACPRQAGQPTGKAAADQAIRRPRRRGFKPCGRPFPPRLPLTGVHRATCTEACPALR